MQAATMRHVSSLYLVLVGSGYYATTSQIVLVREYLAVYSGHELCLAIIFAGWFVGITLGAYTAKIVPNHFSTMRGFFFATCGLSALIFPLSILALRIYGAGFEPASGSTPGMDILLQSALILIVPFGFLIGFGFPLACGIFTRYDPDGPSLTISKIYLIEASGSIAGGCIMSLVLAGRMTSLEIVALSAIVMLAGLSWMSFAERSLGKSIGTGVGMVVWIVVSLALLATGKLRDWDETSSTARLMRAGAHGRRVAWLATPYQHLDLIRHENQYNLYANGKITTTFPDQYSLPVQAHLFMCQHPQPEKIVVMGQVTPLLLPSILLHPVSQVDLVEADPGVLTLCKPYFEDEVVQALSDARTRFYPDDGRKFLHFTPHHYDIIVSLAPDPTTLALNRFYTREFFASIAARLQPGGVFVTRISSSANYLDQDTATLVSTLQKSLLSVFAHVVIFPGQETFLFSSNQADSIVTNPHQLAERYASRHITDRYFTKHHFKTILQTSMLSDLQKQLEKHPGGPLNTDAKPITHLHSILRWTSLTDDFAARPLRFFINLPAWVWFAVVGAFYVMVFILISIWVLKRARHTMNFSGLKKSAGLLAVFTTGGLAMATELIISFSYQSQCGSLYQEIGLIVAAFMTGLVLAGFFVQVKIKKSPGSNHTLGVLLLGLAGFMVCLAFCLSAAWLSNLPFWMVRVFLIWLVFCSGGLFGMIFPLGSQIVQGADSKTKHGAAALDGLDHLGAMIGSIATGIVLLPVLGRQATFYLLASATTLAGLFNLWTDSIIRKTN